MIVSLLLLVTIATVGNCLPLRKSRQIDEIQENLEGGLNATVYLLVSIRYRIYTILYYYSICSCLFTYTLIMKQ